MTITTTKRIATTEDIILWVFLLLKLNIPYTSFLKGFTMKPLLLPSILILFWVLHHNLRKSRKTDKHNIQSFLNRESDANGTRKKDISNLDYIKVPLDTLPLDITLNDEKMQSKIIEYKKEILSLSKKPMLNLLGVTNTELKEQYGPANLEQLTICDQNYCQLIRTLHLFAECIYEEHPEAAVRILEYCLSIGTDISGTYDLLGSYYLNHHDQEHFLQLYDRIPKPASISGKTIINKLNSMKSTSF